MDQAPRRHEAANVFLCTDYEWIEDTRRFYGFSLPYQELLVPHGAVLWHRGFKQHGGQCQCYGGAAGPRTWLIELSYERHKVSGRAESTDTLAHEMLHAFLWERYGDSTHGSHFLNLAQERGIRRYCDSMQSLERVAAQRQVKLL